MRDTKTLESMRGIGGQLEQMQTTFGALIRDASDEQAPGHAGLYTEIRTYIGDAVWSMEQAIELMEKGDPEDYA